ncbi:MAG: thrombospondin type 3 repeat-containing protein [Deltaproteobacteria bacterium]|nr:thrombospondin type 3 repeat-containing protein [Deltaproteobacteria bacterium]MBN2673109.1 thrombospondin type 3 repeat-containing protein [Deltaproteobacteria bacterium]
MKRYLWFVILLFVVGCSNKTNGDGGTDTESDTGTTIDSGSERATDTTTPSTDTNRDSDTAVYSDTDGDGDGTADLADNCPAVANADQTDMDADGIGDLCDNCPTWGNSSQADADSDGTGDACQSMVAEDPDGDGVALGDNCSLESNADQADEDSDGVGDVCDNCVAAANPFQEDLDGNGIGDHCEEALEIPLGTPICASGSTESVRLASNLYILLDLSTSMLYEAQDNDTTRWEVVTTAMDGVADDLAAGFNIGLGAFPAPCDDPSGSYTCNDTPSACSAERLPYEILPMQAGRDGQVIRETYADITPFGTTPTATALTQILENRTFELPDDPYAAQRTSAVVLITDGDPNSGNGSCNTNNDLNDTVAAAETLAEAGITVYVIGLTGVNESAVEEIAVAGGGNNPNDPDRTWFPAEGVETLSDALMVIAGASIGCSLSISADPADMPDWDRASVVMTLSDTDERVLTTQEYTINTATPVTMSLSGTACDELQSSAGTGQEVGLEIRVACAEECDTEEICGDGIDNNCNDLIDEDCGVFCVCVTDETTCGDCPSECIPAEEACDGIDNDCDGIIDEGCCIPQEEICDTIDNDCDGLIDEGCGVVME